MITLPDKIQAVLLFVGLIWFVFVVDLFLPLEHLALFPRRISGIPGIALLPFLHKNLPHLIANSVPLFILLSLLTGSRENSSRIVIYLIAIGGILHWVFGRSVPVVGASGLVFALISYLIYSGFLEKRLMSISVGIIVGLLYGTTLLFGVLPGQPGVSWDGHLFGAIAGLVTAQILSRKLTH